MGDTRKMLIDEAHKSKSSVHQGSTKMYLDLKTMYWWTTMKTDIAKYINNGLMCSLVKSEHQRPYKDLEPLHMP